MLRAILALPLVVLPGCATVISGASQTVTLATLPREAACTVYAGGRPVGAVAMTPGDVRLKRSSKDLVITCAKEGYQTATVQQEPKFSGVTFGNFVLGGPVGFIVDAASGASFYYPSEVKLGLAPDPAFSRPLALAPALDSGFDQPGSEAAGL